MRINNGQVTYAFSKDSDDGYRVSVPATLTIETMDCFSNQLRSNDDVFGELDWDRINPATGPIYVEEAQAGDTLKVTIHEINLNEKGTVCAVEGEGTLGHTIKGEHLRVLDIYEDHVDFLGKYHLPLKKMIGVIGVAPEGKAVNNGTPGKHGGNMDTLMITEGATLYLPVATQGALFGLGDVHAVMGDGEIGVSGLETPAEINLTLEVIKGKAPKFPVLENDREFAIIVSKETTDEGMAVATELMMEFLEERIDGLTRPEIIMLMSLIGDVQVSQIVDPEKTVRFVFPKAYMDRKEF